MTWLSLSCGLTREGRVRIRTSLSVDGVLKSIRAHFVGVFSDMAFGSAGPTWPALFHYVHTPRALLGRDISPGKPGFLFLGIVNFIVILKP